MNTSTIVGALVALIIGLGGGYIVRDMQAPQSGTHQMADGSVMTDVSLGDMAHEMEAMTGALKGKSGDAFDKEFLAQMIVHHQGAVDMANMVLASGAHAELKQLAQGIIAAQTSEIAQMQGWQKEWYGVQQ